MKLRILIKKENFEKWFNGSKVVDKNGNPLVVYHGSTSKFNAFDVDKIFPKSRRAGFYFTSKKDLADLYTKESKNLIKVYLRIKNPLNSDETKIVDIDSNTFKILCDKLDIPYNPKQYESFDSDVDILSYLFRLNKNALKVIYEITGKDGFIFGNTFVVFLPNQIKSIDNDGTFDWDDTNIYS